MKSLPIAVTVTLALVPAFAQEVQPPAAAKSVELRYRCKRDSTHGYHVVSQMQGKLTIQVPAESKPNEIALNSRVELAMELRCSEVLDKGLRFVQTVQWILIDGEVTGLKYHFDSRHPEEVENDTFSAPYARLAAIIAKPLPFEVGIRGGAHYRPKALRELAALGGIISPDDLERMLNATFPPLPEKTPQEIGATWEASETLPLRNIGEVEVKIARKLDKIEAGGPSVAVALSPSVTAGAKDRADPGEIRVEESGGRERFRADDGLIASHATSLKLAVKLVEKDLLIGGSVSLSTRIEHD